LPTDSLSTYDKKIEDTGDHEIASIIVAGITTGKIPAMEEGVRLPDERKKRPCDETRLSDMHRISPGDHFWW
jgi:hypothetical protein